MSPWGWTPERKHGIWRYGASWIKPFVVASPWLTVLLLILMFYLIGGKFTLAKGVLFELQPTAMEDGEATKLVAMVIPMSGETLVFFDDARYMLGDPSSSAAFGEHVSERVLKTNSKSLLVLADRRVSGGDLMKFSGIVRRGGVERVLFAGKKQESEE